MKLQHSGNRYNITVPKKLVDAMDWSKGQELEYKIKDDETLELKEK